MIFNFFKKTKVPIGNIFFKSNQHAYEYVQKYFSNYKLEKKVCITAYMFYQIL